MIIVPITPAFSRGMAGLQENLERRFGKWWSAAWLTMGVLGFIGWIITIQVWMPDIAEIPTDRMGWFLFAFLLVTCIFGGPATLGGVPFAFVMFGVCSWLLGT